MVASSETAELLHAADQALDTIALVVDFVVERVGMMLIALVREVIRMP